MQCWPSCDTSSQGQWQIQDWCSAQSSLDSVQLWMYVTHERACWDTVPLALCVKQPSAPARVTPLTFSQINLQHALAFPSAPAGPRLCPLTENGTTSLPPARVARSTNRSSYGVVLRHGSEQPWGASLNSQSGLTMLMWFYQGPHCFQLLPCSHSR